MIPAFRESTTIERAITTVAEKLEGIVERYEIVVVDNASPDGTAKIARAAARDLPVRVLENDRNRGKGYSVQRGMLASRGEWRFFYDADLSTHPDEIERFWELAQSGQADVLVGSRLAAGASIARMQPIPRRLAGRLMLTVSRALFGTLTSDIFCGYKWFRGGAADQLFADARATGWVFDLEILTLARIHGYDVLEVPIEWENHEDTRLNMSRDWLTIGLEMVRIKWNTRNRVPRAILTVAQSNGRRSLSSRDAA